jgi:hypothetical protein
MDLAGEEAAEAERLKGSSAEGGPRRTRGRGTRGEMGLESIIVKSPGPKQKREHEEVAHPGGIEWNHRIMLNAVWTHVLGKSSQKEAGVAGLHFLSRNTLEVYAKAQPLGKHK